MKSLWNSKEVKNYGHDPLGLRVYTSRLLGREPSLVLHGGGNTSVKATHTDKFRETEEILYVKGSGWDLATIERPGFAPVKMDALLKMAKLKTLSDAEMVKLQRAAMIDPYAPNPSVEAILHAIIPFKFVDHTHADAVVTISNTPDGAKRIHDLFGKHFIIVPYIMPGFMLAKKVYEMTKNINWQQRKGMILLNHGIFTFDNEAKASYEQMIHLVTKAEKYLKDKKAVVLVKQNLKKPKINYLALAKLRRLVSQTKGKPVLAKLEDEGVPLAFSRLKNVLSIASRGPLTPDHVIRTKRVPVILSSRLEKDIHRYAESYQKYFKRNARQGLTCLDPAPRWAVWPGQGIVSFGGTVKEVKIVSDIVHHTMVAIQKAQRLKRWKALPQRDIFEVEYWELEQAKLEKAGKPPIFQGKVAFVTGAANGIGRACVEQLLAQGAVVAALDINKKIENMFDSPSVLGITCDVTKPQDLQQSVEQAVRQFGGLDILVSNVGIFPPSQSIVDMQKEIWERSMAINLSSHQRLWQQCIPYLTLGMDPIVIIVGSKNVPAPGPGASAYSVSKAGLTQLGRVAALELASCGIRVNVIHPNQVFDTGIWTDNVLKKRAASYGMSVEEYKSSNLLKTRITSKDVAELVCAVAGPVFAKTTGAQIPIDGGNERVI